MSRTSDPHILITRPSGQHEDFAAGCRVLGFRVSHLPCVEIVASNTNLANQDVQAADIVLFTSRNAVEYAHKSRPLPWPGVTVHAIGPATEAALRLHQQAPAVKPVPPYTSEAYAKALLRIDARRLLVIKGEGGREHIRSSLATHGWHVSEVDVYARKLPVIDADVPAAIFSHTSMPDIVSVTSDEILLNLLRLTTSFRAELFRLPLVVNSQRCARLARSLGFAQQPLVAEPAGDQGQLEQLKAWLGGIDISGPST